MCNINYMTEKSTVTEYNTQIIFFKLTEEINTFNNCTLQSVTISLLLKNTRLLLTSVIFFFKNDFTISEIKKQKITARVLNKLNKKNTKLERVTR